MRSEISAIAAALTTMEIAAVAVAVTRLFDAAERMRLARDLLRLLAGLEPRLVQRAGGVGERGDVRRRAVAEQPLPSVVAEPLDPHDADPLVDAARRRRCEAHVVTLRRSKVTLYAVNETDSSSAHGRAASFDR